MSADGSIELTWAGEERRFRLAIGQLRELQEAVNKNRGANPIGPWSLYQLISKGDAWPDELREVIKLGLIGGGTKLELVPGLLKRYVEERPILESVPVAMSILGVALLGDVTDKVGKKKTPENPTFSDSPTSTAPEPQLDSVPDKSTNVPFGNSQHASRDGTDPKAATFSPNP